MIKANYCISIDNNGDRHISLPWRIPNLPNWLTVDSYAPSVEIPVFELSIVVNAHRENNKELVNKILSKYY